MKRLLGTRTTTTQKVLLFAPMVWFAVSVLSLARFKTSSEGERRMYLKEHRERERGREGGKD